MAGGSCKYSSRLKMNDMKYNRVFLAALGYELGPQVVTSAEG